jgi:FlaA1/EpsC-like NDP-sugar epimerase
VATFSISNRRLAILHDLFMIPIAWISAYWLRFNLGVIPEFFLESALENLLIVVVLQGAVFRYFGLYRGVWRFASLPDLIEFPKRCWWESHFRRRRSSS